jgi:hypothetical protein
MFNKENLCKAALLGSLLLPGLAVLPACAGDGSTVKRVSPGWAAIAKWPDLYTGMWQQQMAMSPQGGFAPPPQPVYTDAAEAYLAQQGKVGPAQNGCAPPGMPLMMGQGYAIGFYYANNAIFLMTDMDSLWLRRIFMDRTEHGDPDPTLAGNSIGHWEGNTLVVDTVAIDEDSLIEGVPSHGKTHITERFHLDAPNKLSYEQTIENPDVLAKPLVTHSAYVRRPDWEVQDAWCGEDTRSAVGADGKIKFNLTPPAN